MKQRKSWLLDKKKVLFKLNKEGRSIEVEGSWTVEKAKQLFVEEYEISPAEVELRFESSLMEDSKTLKEYNIQNFSAIEATATFSVEVEYSGEKVELSVGSSETVGELKAKLKERLGIEEDKQSLSVEGKELENSDFLLKTRSLVLTALN